MIMSNTILFHSKLYYFYNREDKDAANEVLRDISDEAIDSGLYDRYDFEASMARSKISFSTTPLKVPEAFEDWESYIDENLDI